MYRRTDPGYDVLYNMANARPLMAGKWQLQDAWKERTEDGYVIGGLGIEPSHHGRFAGGRAPTRTRMTVAGKERAEYGLKPRKEAFATAIDPSSAGYVTVGSGVGGDKAAPFGSGAALSARLSGGGGGGGDGDDDDGSGRTSGRAGARDEHDFVREFVPNNAEVYLEQEWFYVTAAPAQAGGQGDELARLAPGGGGTGGSGGDDGGGAGHGDHGHDGTPADDSGDEGAGGRAGEGRGPGGGGGRQARTQPPTAPSS